MLFVDDDETQVLDRREDGRAGADHDARFSAAYAIPLLGALIGRKRGVQEGHAGAEEGMQLTRHRWGETNLRNQQNGAAAGQQHALHGRQVDCRLARAGHTVQQASAKGFTIERSHDLIERDFLGLVEHVLDMRHYAGKMKRCRPLFERHQTPLDQGLQGGRRQVQPAQGRNGQLTARAGKFGQNGKLIGIELGRPRIRYQHRIAQHTAGIARRGFGFAQQPLLAQHAGQQFCRGAGGVTQGSALGRLPVGEIVQHRVLEVLFVRSEARPARRTLLSAVEQDGLADFADSIAGGAADLRHERKHAAQHLA